MVKKVTVKLDVKGKTCTYTSRVCVQHLDSWTAHWKSIKDSPIVHIFDCKSGAECDACRVGMPVNLA
jgi:hypothetical protein